MAARQTKINALSPDERAKQEEWAQRQLTMNTGQCVAGSGWYRYRDERGYRCDGGVHYVSDELLAEGKGGYFVYSCFRITTGTPGKVLRGHTTTIAKQWVQTLKEVVIMVSISCYHDLAYPPETMREVHFVHIKIT
jgi:hypothetical protein